MRHRNSAGKQPRNIGPFRIIKPLGQGGMGTVYEAMDTATAVRVAIKTVRCAEEGMIASLRREIHALGRLAHPGIVRIVGQGLHDGMPWYAMPLAEGTTLADHVHALFSSSEETTSQGVGPEVDAPAPTLRLVRASGPPVEHSTDGTNCPRSPHPRRKAAGGALTALLSVVRRLCHPLRYLHGEGMVHRDLKPANVLVKADGTPVIIDFGVIGRFTASDLSRETLEGDDQVSGTLAYMAPEQLRGEIVDARADLYSLGCILYELITGQLPFEGDGRSVAMQRLQVAEPPPPSIHVDGVSPELDELVVRLLQRDPSRRPGFADDVGRTLARLGASNGTPGEAPRMATYLYRPALAGRADVLGSLEAASRPIRERGSFAVVIGESGIGKTRLVNEFRRRLTGRNVRTVFCACTQGESLPLAGIRALLQAVADRCLEEGAPALDELLGNRGKILARYEPALRGLPGIDTEPDSDDLGHDAGRLRVMNAAVETIAAFARRRPLLLVIDDLQWADELSLGTLELLHRVMRSRSIPAMVVATCRREELSVEVESIVRAEGVLLAELGRLAESDVGFMVRDMLAVDRSLLPLARFLHRQSQGNPFFVAEYLRTAVEVGLLRRDDAGGWMLGDGDEGDPESAYLELPVPRSIEKLVEHQVSLLGERERAHLECAAVIGELDIDVLRAVAGSDENQCWDAIHELARRHLVTDDGRALSFSHHKHREVIYGGLPDERRRELHRKAAEALESMGPEEERQGEIGRHWREGGDPDRARPCFLHAARRASDAFAHASAGESYEAYLSLVARPTPESVLARLELADRVLRWRGRMGDALHQMQTAHDEAREIGDLPVLSRCLLSLGRLLSRLGRNPEATIPLEEALEIARRIGDRGHEGVILTVLAIAVDGSGQPGVATTLLEEAIAIHRELAQRTWEARSLMNLAIIRETQGDYLAARHGLEESLSIYRSLGDRASEARTLPSLGGLHIQLMQLDEAQVVLERALDILREIGDRSNEGFAIGTLAALQNRRGRREEARRLFEQALAIHREVRQPRLEAGALLALGAMSLYGGELFDAAALLQEGLSIVRDIGDRTLTGHALRSLAEIALFQGDFARARTLLAEATTILAAIGNVEVDGMVHCTLGHVALASGASAREELDVSERLAERLDLLGQTDLGRALEKLRRAQKAFEEGRPLLCGCVADDLREPLRRRLERLETGAAGVPQGSTPSE